MSESEPKPPIMCRRVGCANPATHHLEFRAWATGMPRLDHTGVSGRIPQPLCKRHAREARAVDVITRQGFADICAALHASGQGMPVLGEILILAVEGVPEITLAGLPASSTRH